MLAGATLPHLGSATSPEALVEAARRAEALDYASVWVAERLLYPTDPRTPYPASPDGSLPPFYTHVYTPIETLTWVAAHTSKVAVGTSVLNMPFHNPVMLARQLATLDQFSGGRVRLGLGQGWSADEMEAAGASLKGRAARADEFVEVLKKVWTTDPVQHRGEHFSVPRSILQPKPVQQPRPPIYMAAYAPSALERVGKTADGWMPAGVPLAAIGPMMDGVRAAARAAGRDPAALKLVILAFPAILEQSPGEGRPDFVGTLDEVRRDVATARDLGASEIIFAPGYSTGNLSLDEYHRDLERLRELV
jgi:probable F420-dependent oxidoreductase